MKIRSLIVLTALTLTAFSASAAPKEIFHAPFDTDFSAKIHGKTVSGKHTQKLSFEDLARLLQPGAEGKAALVGKTSKKPGDSYSITYPAKGLIGSQGTISFWVKPVDWRPTDHNFHIFFEASGQDSFLVIYKYFDNTKLFFLYGAKKAKSRKEMAYSIARKNISDWKVNQWHFITCAWDKKKIWLYVDGSVVDSRPVSNLPRTPFPNIKIGGSKNWKTLMNKTLIDDVKIFDGPLSAQQTLALYHSYKSSKPVKSGPLKISHVFARTNRPKKQLRLSFMLSRFQPDLKAYKVKFSLIDSNKKSVIKKIFTSKDTEYDQTIDVSKLKAGTYQIRIAPLMGKKEKAVVREISYAIPTSPAAWAGKNCGVSSKVPIPWTDMKLSANNTVECWNRKFVFKNNLFPTQISSGKYNLLQKPIKLVINGKPFSAPAKVKIVKQSANAVELQNTAENSELTVTANITIEYDGFMWMKLKVKPKKSLTVNSMTLDVPIRKSCAKLFNMMRKFYMKNKKGFVGKTPDKTVDIDIYQYDPVVWIGNEDVGLEWFTENMKDWHNSNKKRAVQILSKNNAKILRLNIIDSKIVLNKSRDMAFGFQPTPVRAAMKNWRKQRDRKNIQIWFIWSTRHNVPDAQFKNSNYMQERRSYERNGRKPFHYLAGFSLSPYFPEWPWWADLWSKNPPLTGSYAKPENLRWSETFVCNNAKSYRDFYTWKFKATQKTMDMKNLYFDNQWPKRCRNRAHGCGWLDDDGVLRDTYNVLGTRDLAKRMYIMVKDYDPEALIIRHMSAIQITPVNGFADMTVDGELYMGDVGKEESYFNVFTPDMFRASFLSRQFTKPNLFIPQFERAFKNHNKAKLATFKAGKLKNQKQKLRHFKGYFLVHDAKLYPIFGIKMDDFWALEDEFGIDDNTPFYGYWQKNKPFELLNPGSDREMVSAYVNNDKIMFILMNDTDSAKTMKIRINKKGIKDLTDFESNEKIKVNNNIFKASVKARDYRILMNKK
jgi:glycosyl hydrolase family 123/concanavalin A-like lectin/glucanase superfamily protein